MANPRSVPDLLNVADQALQARDCNTAWTALEQSWTWLKGIRAQQKQQKPSFARAAALQALKARHGALAKQYRRLCRGVAPPPLPPDTGGPRSAASSTPTGHAPKYEGSYHRQAIEIKGYRDVVFPLKRRDPVTGKVYEVWLPALDTATTAGFWVWIAEDPQGKPLPRRDRYWRWQPGEQEPGKDPRARKMVEKQKKAKEAREIEAKKGKRVKPPEDPRVTRARAMSKAISAAARRKGKK